MNSSKKQKRKAYIISSKSDGKKKKWESTLSPGLRGFLCTCNGNEKGCIREALNILDEYYLKINPETKPSCDDDIEQQLKNEITEEKSLDKKFKVVDSGAKSCVFISSKVHDVIGMAEKIMYDAKNDTTAKSRFLIRLVPIEITCKSYNDDIKKAAEQIFDAHFKCEPTSYCIVVNKRSNNNLLRMEVIDDLARLVRDRNTNHTVNLKNPEKTVIVEIIRNICCLSVVKNFYNYKKFNLIELGSTKKPNDCSSPSEGTKDVSEVLKPTDSELDSKETTDTQK